MQKLSGMATHPGRSWIRRRIRKLDALSDILAVLDGPLSEAPALIDPGGISGPEREFLKRLAQKQNQFPGRFRVYRARRGSGLGDFVIVDMSDAAGGRVVALEHKMTDVRKASRQVDEKGVKVLSDAGFQQIDMVTANTEQFMEYVEKFLAKRL